MKFLYVVRTGLHIFPPCLNQISYLREMGYEVIAIYGDCDDRTKLILEKMGVKTINLSIKRSSNKYVGKIQSYVSYRDKVLRILSQNYLKGDFVWYGTADSCFSLGQQYNKYDYVLNVLELYDDNNFYKKGVQRVIHNASAVLACEYTRANIMQMWWNLDNPPYVMPNKPYSLPKKNSEGSIRETKDIISQMRDKKVFLYQGIISADRSLGLLADALNELDDKDIYLGLMGKELTPNSVDNLKRRYNRTIYFGYVPAPYHLEVTGNAFAGIAYYQGCSLNNLFCAPNKIYEYSGFGVPILCNDIPGLRNTVGVYHAGECVDFNDRAAIIEAVKNITMNRNDYMHNSQLLFNSVDNKEVMRRIVTKILSKQEERK